MRFTIEPSPDVSGEPVTTGSDLVITQIFARKAHFLRRVATGSYKITSRGTENAQKAHFLRRYATKRARISCGNLGNDKVWMEYSFADLDKREADDQSEEKA